MRRLVLLTAVIALFSCGPQQPRTQNEIVTDLFGQQFDSLAYDCEVVSVALIDTLFAKMPKNDPHYLELIAKRDSLQKVSDAALKKWIRSHDRSLNSTIYKKFTDASDAVSNTEKEIKGYMRNYRASIDVYVYKIIVKSDSYELKRDVEEALYLIDTSLTRVRAVPSDYLDQLERLRELEEFMLFM